MSYDLNIKNISYKLESMSYDIKSTSYNIKSTSYMLCQKHKLWVTTLKARIAFPVEITV